MNFKFSSNLRISPHVCTSLSISLPLSVHPTLPLSFLLALYLGHCTLAEQNLNMLDLQLASIFIHTGHSRISRSLPLPPHGGGAKVTFFHPVGRSKSIKVPR